MVKQDSQVIVNQGLTFSFQKGEWIKSVCVILYSEEDDRVYTRLEQDVWSK
jgi:hypothetical protein